VTSLAQGSAGLALVLSFALLCPRQVTAALHLLVVQAGAVAVAAAARNQPIAAAGELLLGAVLAPIFVGRLLDRLNIARTSSPAGGTRLAVIAGAILALLAMPIGGLGLPLAVVLLAILLIATRRHPVMQLIGLLALQNGLVLAALEADWAGRYATSCPVVPGLVAAALWLRPPSTRAAQRSIGR
jgi:hydrogenase-4 component E